MTPRNPTNADLLKEIRDVKAIVEDHGRDINDLKNWKIAVEAAKEALKEYQAREESKREEPSNSKALAAVVGVIGLLTAVILALIKAS